MPLTEMPSCSSFSHHTSNPGLRGAVEGGTSALRGHTGARAAGFNIKAKGGAGQCWQGGRAGPRGSVGDVRSFRRAQTPPHQPVGSPRPPRVLGRERTRGNSAGTTRPDGAAGACAAGSARKSTRWEVGRLVNPKGPRAQR